MKKFFRTLLCKILGHQYNLLRVITATLRELKCDRCHAEFCANDALPYPVPLTEADKTTHDAVLPNAIKKLNREQAEIAQAVENYNRILHEAKVLQNRLELSTNLATRVALDRRINEKWRQLEQIKGHMPDGFKQQVS